MSKEMARYSKTQLMQCVTAVCLGDGLSYEATAARARILGDALARCDKQNAADERQERNARFAMRAEPAPAPVTVTVKE